MAMTKAELEQGSYITYADMPDDANDGGGKGDYANFITYSSENNMPHKSDAGAVPKGMFDAGNYALYQDTPFEPESVVKTIPDQPYIG